MSTVKRRFIKEKEASQLLSEFFKKVKLSPRQLPAFEPPVELAETNGEEIFFVDRQPLFAKVNNKLFPTLAVDKLLSKMVKVTVNMGAVPYICNGADVMAPGIVDFEETFSKEDIVVVRDERHQKPIAITIALCSSEEAKKLERGKVLKNIHHVGDTLWKTIKQLS
ncbi:MAG: DUF1947 domain-containing protein [Candidatus Bathyarchaeia archaeon]